MQEKPAPGASARHAGDRDAPPRPAPADALAPVLARAVAGRLLQRKVSYGSAPAAGREEQIVSRLVAHQRREGLAPVDAGKLRAGLAGIEASPQSYGVIDIDDPQHIAMLWHHVAMRTSAEPARMGEVARADLRARAQANAFWRRVKTHHAADDTPRPRYFPLALIGAGASMAYYVSTLSPNFDPKDAVVISGEQPWRAKRGKGVLGHPEHMVDPSPRAPADDAVEGVWMDRGAFSDRVAAAFAAFEQVSDKVSAITRDPPGKGGLYRLVLKDAPYVIYAEKVVGGVGSGGHTVQGTPATGTTEEIAAGRIMDMDVFTNVAGRLGKEGEAITVDATPAPEQITVVLSGGNAAIDAAFDALNRGYKLKWIVGSTGPKFLPGFFNYAAIAPFLEALGGMDVSKLDDAAKRNIGIATETERTEKLEQARGEFEELYREQDPMFEDVVANVASRKLDALHFGRVESVARTATGVAATIGKAPREVVVTGDIFVYGIGQDFSENPLFAGFTGDLAWAGDRNRRFTDTGAGALGMVSSDGTLELVGSGTTAMARTSAPDASQLHGFDKALSAARVAVADCVDGMDYLMFSDVFRAYYGVWKAWMLRRPDDGTVVAALTAFDKAAKTYFEARRSLVPTAAQREAVAAFDKATRAIVDRLPAATDIGRLGLSKNVLAGEQLTPIRSQVRARAGFVPHNIAQHVDFVAADRTELAVHIAAQCPRLSGAAGRASPGLEALVDEIIASRGKPGAWGGIPVPPNDARFQRYWREQLRSREAGA